MTAATGAAQDEKPWGFEREGDTPSGWQDVSVKVESIGRKVFTADGMLDALLGKVRAMLNTRGPDDYEKNERDLQSLILEAVKVGARHGGYHEAPKNGGASWHKAVLTIACGVALAGILGGVAMYGKLSAVEANQINQQKQLDNLSQMVLNLTRRNQ